MEEPTREEIVNALETIRTVCENYGSGSMLIRCKGCPLRSGFGNCWVKETETKNWPYTTLELPKWKAFE